MKAAVDFLTGLARVMSAMNLYRAGHPALDRALGKAHESLVALQEDSPKPRFNFLGDEVVLDDRILRELKHWDWSARLANAGVQRLELLGPVSREDFGAFLDEVYARVSGTPVSSAEVRQGRPSNIRYGELSVRGGPTGGGVGPGEIEKATLAYSLREEIDGVDWLHRELQDGRQLQMLEAEGIVRSLTVAMHSDQAYLIPLLQLKQYDQYTVTHTLNVAVLTMALAEFIGLSPREVRAFGIAGLLHDLGKVTIPTDILNKPGALDPRERELMNRHSSEGARIILASEDHLDLAAVVAYEHHLRIDGGGYPSLRHKRACHHGSSLVHVCDVFDALRTRRPYREAWPTERALAMIEEGAGLDFDPELARAFVQMMRQMEGRVSEVGLDAPVLTPQPSPGKNAPTDAVSEGPTP